MNIGAKEGGGMTMMLNGGEVEGLKKEILRLPMLTSVEVVITSKGGR